MPPYLYLLKFNFLLRQRLLRKSFRSAKDWSIKRGRFSIWSNVHQTSARRPISFLKLSFQSMIQLISKLCFIQFQVSSGRSKGKKCVKPGKMFTLDLGWTFASKLAYFGLQTSNFSGMAM